MKKYGITAFIIASAILATSSYAGMGEFENQKTTCYVFKNDKLQKKSSCTASGASGGGADYGIFNGVFKMKGYGTFDVVDNEYQEEHSKRKEIQLNNKKAIGRFRDVKSLKIITEKEFNNRLNYYNDKWNNLGWENADAPNWLYCYYRKSANIEFCYLNTIY